MALVEITVEPSGVARVELARPEVFNAFDEGMIAELGEAFTRLGVAGDVRVVVLSGRGRHFCAGADLGWMRRQAQNSPQANLADARRFTEMLRAIYECPKPTLARVQGSALGGGVGLMCACDIVVAAQDARFAVSEVKFGILPSAIGPYLINAVGLRQARRLALTAESIGADWAVEIGLAHEQVPADRLDARIAEIARLLLAGGPRAQGEVKALFRKLAVGPVTDEVRELTAATIGRVRATPEAQEGFAAFFDKRPPGWAPPEA